MADSAPAIAIIYIAYVWPNISSKLSELINIKNVIANNIISIEISINIIFFLFKTKPKIPIKKSIKDKFIVCFIFINNILLVFRLALEKKEENVGNSIFYELIPQEENIILYYCSSSQLKNFSIDTDSITIGIELCKIPHISEHCP